MLIVRLDTGESGTRANQLVYPALAAVPEGWVQIPEALEAMALELLPWLGLETRDGAVAGIHDDDISRAAAVLAARETGAHGTAQENAPGEPE